MQQENKSEFGLVMLVSIDIKIENNILLQAQTVCYFYYSFFKQIIYSLFICLEKIWLCDNQPLIVKLPKQYKNKEGVKISTIVFTQTIVLVSELTP